MRNLSNRLVPLAIICFLFASTKASAQLLLYEWGSSGYTTGSAAGQPYLGSGGAPGGTWNNNEFADGFLTYPNLVTIDEKHILRTADDMILSVDTTPGGVFDSEGMVGSNGNVGGAEVSGTLYFSFLGQNVNGTGAAWGGFNLWYDGKVGGDPEQIGIGNAGVAPPDSFRIYHQERPVGTNSEPEIGTPPTPIDSETHLFVMRADYVGSGQDMFTVWLDPDPLLGELAQDPNISVIGYSRAEDNDDGFNSIHLRGDASDSWRFDEIRVGASWADAVPAVPEPSTAVLAIACLSAMAIGLRRRRSC